MGVLSNSARKAYKRGVRRAHVPEWFLPASYVFAGLAVLIVIGLGLRGSDPRPYAVADATQPSQILVGGDPSDQGNGASPADTIVDNTNGVDATLETVATVDGATVSLPRGAQAAALTMVRAIFTGNFDDVVLYPGQTAPVLIAPWPSPEVRGVVGAQTFSDGSIRVSYQVDPDGAGPEKQREVSVLIVLAGAQWTYLPG